MVEIIGVKKTKLTKEQLLSDPKIQPIDIVGESIHFFRRQKPLAKIGLYVGKFSTLSPKDCVFLSLCRTNCDILIVLLQSDYSARLNKEQSILEFSGKERAFAVASLPFVDWVCLYDEESPALSISKISPNYIFHGLNLDDKPRENLSNGQFFEIEHPFEKSFLPKSAIPLKFFDLKVSE